MRIHPSNNSIRETNSVSPNPCGATRPRISCGLAAISIAVAAALAASVPTFAATTSTATWTDASGDHNWANPANWSYTVVPNPLTSPGNGGGGIDNYNAIIGSPSPTNLSGVGTIGLASLTINSGGVLNTSSTGLDTGEFFNSGTVNVTGSLQLQAAALQGSGTIALVSGTTPASLTLQLPPYTVSISPTTSITSSNIITGAGSITVYGGGPIGLINSGAINADVANGTLIYASPTGVSNQGLFEATNGGTLSFGNTILTQTAAGLVYADGGNVSANSMDGGTISTDNGGTVSTTSLSGSATNPLNIMAASIVEMASGTSYFSGNITNNGTINLGGAAGTDSQIDLNGNTIIGGTGSVVLAGGTLYLQQGPSTGTSDNLTLGPSQTLSGTGTLETGYSSSVTLTNDGTVNANVAGGALAVAAPYFNNPITNNGTLEATNGGTLDVENVAQSVTGVIDAASGNVQIESVSGGTLESAKGYAVNLVSAASAGPLVGSEISGTTANPLAITSGSTVVVTTTEASSNNVGVSGAVTNNGMIQIAGPAQSNSGVQVATLLLTANTDISGSGTIALSNNGGIDSTGDSGQQVYTLTVGPQQTISGDGYLGLGNLTNPNTLNVVNNGTIDANSAGGGLSVGSTGNQPGTNTATITNNNVLEATNNGTLSLESTEINQSSAGVIYAHGGTVVIATDALLGTAGALAGPMVSGGALQSAPGSEIQSGNSFVLSGSAATPTTITTGTIVDAPLVVANRGEFVTPTSIQISGTVTNDGLIRVGDNPSGIFPIGYPQFLSPELLLRPNSTLSGTGSAAIDPSPYQIYNQQNPTSTPIPPSQLHESELAINAAEFGTGTSVMDNQLTNGGIVLADGTGGTLELQADNTNNGTYEAEGGGVLQVDSGTLANYSSGTLTGGAYDAASGGSINLVGASITTNAANVTLDGASSTFAAIAPITQNTGSFTLTNSAAFTTTGDFTNTGTVAVLNGADFVVTGKLTNSGTITLDPSTISVNGDMILQSDSTLTFGLSSNTSGQYDQINVSGAATLAGTLSVNVLSGFTPTLGETFTILTASNGITGSFNQSTVTSGLDVFQLQYSNGSVQLDTTAVPEPATLVLLAVAGAGLVLLRRRKTGCNHGAWMV